MDAAPHDTALALLEQDPSYKLAQKLFFEHSSLADISRATGATIKTIKSWRDKAGWLTQREDQDRGLLEDAFGARKVTLARLLRSTADQLLRGVEHIQNRPDPPTLDETVKLSMVLSNLDKLARLDTDRSTENVAVKAQVALTAEQIRKAISEDPFFDVTPEAAE